MRRPRDLADTMRRRVNAAKYNDGLTRETFTLPRDEARAKAREWLDRYPSAAYSSKVEKWALLPDGRVSFTMCRLPSAD